MWPLRSSVGAADRTLTAPPVALRPYSAPWGPRRHLDALEIKQRDVGAFLVGNISPVVVEGDARVAAWAVEVVADAADEYLRDTEVRAEAGVGNEVGEVCQRVVPTRRQIRARDCRDRVRRALEDRFALLRGLRRSHRSDRRSLPPPEPPRERPVRLPRPPQSKRRLVSWLAGVSPPCIRSVPPCRASPDRLVI